VAKRLTSISRRLIVTAVLIHGVLMLMLYFALDTVVAQTNLSSFIDEARTYGRGFADGLEELDLGSSASELVRRLDDAMLEGKIVYVALLWDGDIITSSLMNAKDTEAFIEDFTFGDHGDDTYFLSLPVLTSREMAILQLGFDEMPMRLHTREVQRDIIFIIVVYLLATLAAMAYLGANVVRPIKWLQAASRRIASGEHEAKLETDSGLAEIHDLAADLERMRSELVGTNARLQDEISERQAAEEERRKLEIRLQQSQRLESLGTLAGGVAHEFNNLLQPLILYTDLALEDLPHNSSAQRNLERVMDLAKRARGLSSQILSFGRPATAREFKIVSLSSVVVEALAMIRALLPATVDIRTDIHGDAIQVKCDPAQIQQLVINLCNNAARALQGGGHIMVTLSSEEISAQRAGEFANLGEGQYAVLEVADTGHGMDPETLQRAFEPFYTTQEVGEGTGLGLSVVHGIVMRHGGEITLTSELNKGTTIRVYFPIELQSTERPEETGN